MTDVVKIVTPNFITSFPAVFTPKEFNGKEKYSVLMLFDKGDDISALKKLAKDAAVEKWGKVPTPFKSPFRDGDTEKDLEKYPAFENKIFVSAGSLFQPGLVDQKRQPILDETEFYAGCVARASVTVYCWEFQGKKGVSFNLVNLQKVAEGEKLSGRTDAADEFGEIETDEVLESDEFGLDDI
jgi:hypothetical protein